jgi:hypothetical protein
MNRDDIIRMADEAKLTAVMEVFEEELERFAALVAAAEQEACAKVCDDIGGVESDDCAAAIRARGDT